MIETDFFGKKTARRQFPSLNDADTTMMNGTTINVRKPMRNACAATFPATAFCSGVICPGRLSDFEVRVAP